MSMTSTTGSPIYRTKASASSHRAFRFSPYKLAKKSPTAGVLLGHPHAHPNPPPPKFSLPVSSGSLEYTEQDVQYTTQEATFVATDHVEMDFLLFNNGVFTNPSAQRTRKIMDLFPTSTALNWIPPFIVVVCDVLPPKPWPITVAGVALYLTDDPEDLFPIPVGVSARGANIDLPIELSLWGIPGHAAWVGLFKFFDAVGAPVEDIQWTGSSILAISARVPTPGWESRYPRAINEIRVGYIFGENTNLEEMAMRARLPQDSQPDDTNYAQGFNQLRPGVVVTSKDWDKYPSKDIVTTSGVCLRSPSGRLYLTVAKHGFPGGVEDLVWHPDRHGVPVAKVTKVLGETDMALAELRPGVRYSKETFSVPGYPVREFTALADPIHMPIGSFVYMDNPFNGRCEGTLISVVARRIPEVYEPSGEMQYVCTDICSFGVGGQIMFNGCCGSVLWNKNHEVVAQFRMQQSQAPYFSWCPSFKDYKDWGYTIASVP
ncbi:MAG: hypothetical protein Q9220_002722 [cf. Caloplaca sp. 1 TL-2023]